MKTRAACLLVAVSVGIAPARVLAQSEDATGPADLSPSSRQAFYRVGPGDVIGVLVFGEDALSREYPVSPAGDIDFPLLGAIPVDGMTTADIGALLRQRLTQGYINHPNVTVTVQTFASQPVQVLGAVAKPGLYFLQGPTTVLQMLSVAGGVAPEGANEVRITHEGGEGDTVVLGLEQLLTQTARAVEIASGDVVFVPQSLVSVMGEVNEPGEITWREGLTLSRGIAATGGALSTANLRKVYVLRGDERIEVNVRRILAGKDPDFPLLSGDRVFVNESIF